MHRFLKPPVPYDNCIDVLIVKTDGQSEPQSANTEHEAAGSRAARGRTNGVTLIRRKLPFGNGSFYEWIGPETRYRYIFSIGHVENIILSAV